VNPIIGSRLVTTETETINRTMDTLVKNELARRKIAFDDYLTRKNRYLETKDHYSDFLTDISSIYDVKPTLCDLIVEKTVKLLLVEFGLEDLVCDSSGGHDHILNAKQCLLRVHLKNGTDKKHLIPLQKLVEPILN
jgi:hypothetical protein